MIMGVVAPPFAAVVVVVVLVVVVVVVVVTVVVVEVTVVAAVVVVGAAVVVASATSRAEQSHDGHTGLCVTVIAVPLGKNVELAPVKSPLSDAELLTLLISAHVTKFDAVVLTE